MFCHKLLSCGIFSLALLFISFSASAQLPGKCGCNRCEALRKVQFQFNALRLGNITLPQNIYGQLTVWTAEGLDSDFIELQDDGKTLNVKSLPKGEAHMAGFLKAQCGNETFAYPLTIAADDEMYGYLYCHMAVDSENTLYAIGTDGQNFEPLIDNQPVYNAEKIAQIEGGVRDAFICRASDPQGGYLMVTTDMSNHKTRTWWNHGINLLRSNDLVHWTSVTFDFRRGPQIFSDPTSQDIYSDYTLINRVWAPQVVWDASYDNGKGGYFVYYSMLSTNAGDDHDRMYYSYANAEFTTLTKPCLLHDRGIAMIDCHIDFNDCDSLYHVFYKREGADMNERGIYEATFNSLGSGEWTDCFHVNFEGGNNVEGPSAFRLINRNEWKMAYIRYSGGRFYKLCDGNADLSVIKQGNLIGGEVKAQHGSFMTLTIEEYNMLKAWSDLTLRVQQLDRQGVSSRRLSSARKALLRTYQTNAVSQLLKDYTAELNKLNKLK